MHIIIGLIFIIALAVWLWGEDVVKQAIKWMLVLGILGVILLVLKK